MISRVRFLLLIISVLPVSGICGNILPSVVQSTLKFRNVPDNSLSIRVENLDTGELLLTWNEDVPRNPASVIKLLTTFVALDTLGPAYSWKTEVYLLGETDGGVLNGDLLLKGYGDPFLVDEYVWQMLREIRQQGISRIAGDLLIDDSYFNVPHHDPATFDREPLRAYNVEPNALLMNFKVVRYHFEPDLESATVNIRIDPPLENLRIKNKLKVVHGPCRGYQRGIVMTPNATVDQIVISGQFPSGCKSYAMDRSVLSHNEFAYGLFKSIWQESGGEFSGKVRNVVKPENIEPFMVFESRPLVDVISKVNKHSNNVMARQLIFTLGAEKFAIPGTEEGGRWVIEDWLTSRQLNSPALKLDNGAGLSRNSRISARNLGEILRYIWQSPLMPELLSSLSLSGIDGTLANRFRNGSLTGKAHIKTGRLDNVNAIAGYLQSRLGRRYSIVALQNHTGIHRGPGEEVQEALLRWVYEQ